MNPAVFSILWMQPDFELDGDQDIAVGNIAMQNAVFFNQGTGRDFPETRFGTEGEITYWLATGDVDGDGFPDLGVANSDGLNTIKDPQATAVAFYQ